MDYNLFPVFVEIMRHRNISKASMALGLTQSATSNALSRLRYQLGDQLFIRTNRGVLPTEYALEIFDRIEHSIENLKSIGTTKTRRTTTLSEISRRFKIVASDLEECLIIPKLVEALSEKAPNIQLEIRPYNRKTIKDEFELNRTDIVMAFLRDDYSNVNSLDLLYQDFCCAVRRGHPVIRENPSLEQFVAQGHLLVSPDKGGFHGVVDDQLKKENLVRKVVASAPHFLSGCQLCSLSDHIITLPRFLAEQVAENFKLNLFELPFKMDGFTIGMHWHQQLHNDPEHRVIRTLIKSVVQKHYHAISLA
ncbi:MAG: LysR family transcriptional regulator [Deltaproteobacteria bacterium]|jgi:DNA-binding transcriptional LysR family regulator|nr:LysR family transcriptional regulator [Deltaproteobacteria bacterium]MBT6501417.1 LysR family transcriptional regulator [Deltaproteobacteria bacterium]MBT6610737.1 LysR family transcriptional regulator [Deltaproteobacteria bacterium]